MAIPSLQLDESKDAAIFEGKLIVEKLEKIKRNNMQNVAQNLLFHLMYKVTLKHQKL